MGIQRISKRFQKGIDSVFTYTVSDIVENFINYVVDSKYRKSVRLTSWLERQVKDARTHEGALKLAQDLKGKTHDSTMSRILRWSRNKKQFSTGNIYYKTDTNSQWKMTEKWQTFDITLSYLEGDCEDGAILMYVLARLNGVPANRLWLAAGAVKGGGHCWLCYMPDEYPLNLVFLDWCYWVNTSSINTRNKFKIIDQTIYEFKENGGQGEQIPSKYYNIWFVFNEDRSHKKFK